MKRTKKITSLLLALVMAFAMTITAFAAEVKDETQQKGSITIENPVAGHTYTIYRILDLESYDTNEGSYVYKVADGWSSFVESGEGKKFLNTNSDGSVTWVENADPAEFAKLAQDYATKNKITANKSNSLPNNFSGSSIEFTGLDLGYYLVDTTLGSLCSLDTTNPNAKMKEKNTVPENEKTVKENSKKPNEEYGKENDAKIGDTIDFKSEITIYAGTENLVFHDNMSKGLTLDPKSIKVCTDKNATQELENSDDKKNYEIKVKDTASGSGSEESITDGCAFEISFKQAYLDTVLESKPVTLYVVYKATLNENAIIAGDGNSNTSKLDYGEEDNTKSTPPSTTTTYTWDFDVFKYNGENEPLAGAKF